jgi:hypothetical protein
MNIKYIIIIIILIIIYIEIYKYILNNSIIIEGGFWGKIGKAIKKTGKVIKKGTVKIGKVTKLNKVIKVIKKGTVKIGKVTKLNKVIKVIKKGTVKVGQVILISLTKQKRLERVQNIKDASRIIILLIKEIINNNSKIIYINNSSNNENESIRKFILNSLSNIINSKTYQDTIKKIDDGLSSTYKNVEKTKDIYKKITDIKNKIFILHDSQFPVLIKSRRKEIMIKCNGVLNMKCLTRLEFNNNMTYNNNELVELYNENNKIQILRNKLIDNDTNVTQQIGDAVLRHEISIKKNNNLENNIIDIDNGIHILKGEII